MEIVKSAKVLVLVLLYIYCKIFEKMTLTLAKHQSKINLVKSSFVVGTDYILYKYNRFYEWFHKKITGSDLIVSSKMIMKNKLMITYKLGEDNYNIIVSTRRKPLTIEKAMSGDKDITNFMISLAGPSGDYHGKKYTMSEMGFHNPIIITDNSGNEITIN